MTLFLTSAGLPIETRNYFSLLLNKKPQKIKVAFIPTAGYPEINKSYIEEDKNKIRSLRISDIYDVDLKEESVQSLHKKLSPADVIYVTGGNTFYLLDWVKKSGFDKVVRNFVNKGKSISAQAPAAILPARLSNRRIGKIQTEVGKTLT